MASATLTPLITSPGDLKRTRRELEALDDFLSQSSLRTGGKAVKLPAISRLLEDMANDNSINLLKKADRDRLQRFLTLLLKKAPVIHITLASEPSSHALSKLLAWLRANIHPQVLVSVGVQPAIAAGCIVRTASHEYDFTLGQSLAAQQALLIKNIRAGEELPTNDVPVAPVAAKVAQPAPKAAAPAKSVTKVEVKG